MQQRWLPFLPRRSWHLQTTTDRISGQSMYRHVCNSSWRIVASASSVFISKNSTSVQVSAQKVWRVQSVNAAILTYTVIYTPAPARDFLWLWFLPRLPTSFMAIPFFTPPWLIQEIPIKPPNLIEKKIKSVMQCSFHWNTKEWMSCSLSWTTQFSSEGPFTPLARMQMQCIHP